MKGKKRACIFNEQYNREIYCTRITCAGCSWHPDVEKLRREALREKLCDSRSNGRSR